ncbi:hypothetical protein ABR738_00975 [Streptomyces sp. Edi4]|uniref:hypothetical protein n=1 Tax=Streptomyces sp. Edi4 TaxID=3162527 RepID=UPI003305C4B5
MGRRTAAVQGDARVLLRLGSGCRAGESRAREVEAAEDLLNVPDRELHHLVRLVLDSVAGVLTAREPALARPAPTAQPEQYPPSP